MHTSTMRRWKSGARAVEMRRTLPESVLQEVGALDPAAIAEVRADAWPDVRDADELADTLHTLIALPEDFVPPEGRSPAETWKPLFEVLRQSNRATRARVPAASSNAGEGASTPARAKPARSGDPGACGPTS